MRNSDDNAAPERKRRLLAPLILLLLFLFGAAFYLRASGVLDVAMQHPWLQAWLSSPAPVNDAKPVVTTALAPTFDIVRVEENGDMVLAGKAEPGSKVRVQSGSAIIGETAADANGEWVLQPEKPLAAGDHSLSLRATQPGGDKSRESDQRIALSIAPKDKKPPVVALAETGKPTRLLQSGHAQTPKSQERAEKAPAEASPPTVASSSGKATPADVQPGKAAETAVAQAQAPSAQIGAPGRIEFEALDYEKNGQGGKIFMNGKAAPNSRVMLYINNAFAGLATAGSDGSWTFAGASDLPAGTHQMRADQVDIATGKVLARAEVTFEREKTEIAASEPAHKPEASQTPDDLPKAPFETAVADMARKSASGPSGQTIEKNATASLQAPKSASASSGSTVGKRKRLAARHKCTGVTVRRGDTLWHISRRCYGFGERYSKIFRSNQGQIRDPNMIYPSQRFVVPR